MKVVLHVCCGVCAAGAAERLTAEGHQIIGLFYNPNIHPREEYQRRLEAAHRVAKEFHFSLEAAPYTPEEWFRATESLENEPEGGLRCAACFRLRLEKSRFFLPDLDGDSFSTTLTTGPSKPAAMINHIGQEIGGDRFLTRDFKKKQGFQKAMELAKKWALYRQNYCGCIYSLKEKQERRHLAGIKSP